MTRIADGRSAEPLKGPNRSSSHFLPFFRKVEKRGRDNRRFCVGGWMGGETFEVKREKRGRGKEGCREGCCCDNLREDDEERGMI